MGRPLSLKLFLLFVIASTAFSMFVGSFRENYLVPSSPISAYYFASIVFVALVYLAYLIAWIGVWRGNRLAYVGSWILEGYSLYIWGSLRLWPVILETLLEILLLGLSWKYFFRD